jgi:hypothetical protein
MKQYIFPILVLFLYTGFMCGMAYEIGVRNSYAWVIIKHKSGGKEQGEIHKVFYLDNRRVFNIHFTGPTDSDSLIVEINH